MIDRWILSSFAAIAAVLLGIWPATEASAQNRFAARIQVNDGVITQYDLDQRTLFLSLLRAPGDPRNLAREQLINEFIQLDEARKQDLFPSEEEIAGGLSEFAGRANLTSEEFVAALGQAGVGAETFRDFVSAGLAWRAVVRGRFGDAARDIPDAQVDRVFAQVGTEGGLRVQILEILLPASTPETALASRERAAEISRLGSQAEFSAAARQYSISPSRGRGGELGWTALDALPTDIRDMIGAMSPGQITRPVELENAVGVFYLANIERVEAGQPDALDVDYALFIAGPTAASAAAVLARIDTCDDLYGIASDLPEDRLIRSQQPLSAVPADIRGILNTLDVGEGSTALVRGGQATVLMLCSRAPSLENSVDLDLVRSRLANNRLGALAANYLAELRARSYIADITN